MRIMGLDYGDKNIGVAISDPLFVTATGIEVIRRTDENSFKKSLARLAELILEYEVGRIVLGYPKNMDDSEGERCIKTLAFRDRLTSRFKQVPVVLWDERLSTVAVGHVLAGLTRDKRDKVIDKVAAVYILQGYLDYLEKKELI